MPTPNETTYVAVTNKLTIRDKISIAAFALLTGGAITTFLILNQKVNANTDTVDALFASLQDADLITNTQIGK
jgi:CHASE3 domain sensor protein